MPYDTLKISAPAPVLSWANHDLAIAELKMAQNVASLPFVFKHVALMPDVHLGKGTLVGSVIATKGAIVPAAIGVDIGCGMAAVKTPFTAEQLDGKLKKIRLDLEEVIPVGFNENKTTDKQVNNWPGWAGFKDLHKGVSKMQRKAEEQMGSLGGGNHFIEVCIDTEDYVWLMLHSGSRGIGNQLAQNHINTGRNLAKLANETLSDPDLAYFVEGTAEFDHYWRDLQWAQEYALYNREVMMTRVQQVIAKHLTGGKPFKALMSVNCHHNYAERETHYGEEVYVTRKGAVRARVDDLGIIPGSMGAKSYIVRGKGNFESYCSCSHGAGRQMSRTKAKNKYTLDDLVAQTAGVECRKEEQFIDEIPAAYIAVLDRVGYTFSPEVFASQRATVLHQVRNRYKSIEQVMANQADLVEVVATLKQVLCVKG